MENGEKSKNSGKNIASKHKKPVSGFKVKVLNFLKRNIAVVVLIIILIIVYFWFNVKLESTKNRYENGIIELITQYDAERDSLQIKSLELASAVFSWSIRSEMMRNNMENLNQLLTVFVQESDANLVQIINSETRMIILSSDKKYEGTKYAREVNFKLSRQVVIKHDQIVSIITPIMGLNTRIGVLIVEVK